MIDTALNLFIFWFIYSLAGWVCEVIYAKVTQRGYEIRNAAIGPINPGYGIAAIILITILNRYRNNPLVIFVVGSLVASILEYFAHWFFEHFFGMTLWDYSKKKFNLNGRIALSNSILFGLLCVLMIDIVHPWISPFVYRTPINIRFIFSTIVLIAFVVEFTIIVVLVGVHRTYVDDVARLWQILKSVNLYESSDFEDLVQRASSEAKTWYDIKGQPGPEHISGKYDFELDPNNDSPEDELNVLVLRLSQVIEERFTKRSIYQKVLYRILPDLKSMSHEEIFEEIKDTYDI